MKSEKDEKEIIVYLEGYEKIKVKGCKHKQLVLCSDGDHDWVYCNRCGLRTPTVPHRNGAWAEDIFAAHKGELYRDLTRLRKFYFLNKEKNEISSSLGYMSEEKEAWWLEDEKEQKELKGVGKPFTPPSSVKTIDEIQRYKVRVVNPDLYKVVDGKLYFKDPHENCGGDIIVTECMGGWDHGHAQCTKCGKYIGGWISGADGMPFYG